MSRPPSTHVTAWRFAGAVVVPVVVVAALIPLRDHVRNTNLALVLVLVVLVAAVVGGRLVGLVVGVVTATAFDFFLTQPYQSFTIERGDDIQTTILLGAVGLLGGELVERTRRSQADADARRQEIARFQRRAELAASGEPPGRLINRSAAELTDLLSLTDVSYQPGPIALATESVMRMLHRPGISSSRAGPRGGVAR